MKYLCIAWTPRRLRPIAEQEAEFLGRTRSAWPTDSMGCPEKAEPNWSQ